MSFSTRWRHAAALPNALGLAMGSPWARLRSLPSSWREFFRHHGVWAPGVRLHRRLDFRAKAMLVATAFVVPTAVLAWLQFSATWQELSNSSRARETLLLARAAEALMNAVNDQRGLLIQAATSPAGAQVPAVAAAQTPAQAEALSQRVELAWQRLEGAYVAQPDAPAVDARLRGLVERYPQLARTRAERPVEETLRLRADFIGQLLDFNEALLLDSALGRAKLPDFLHRARLALHLLPRIEASVATLGDQALRLAERGDRSVAGYQDYAEAYHALGSHLERTRTTALGLAPARPAAPPAAQGSVAAAGSSESERLMQAIDRVRQRAAQVHRQVVAGAEAGELRAEQAALTQSRTELRQLQAEQMQRISSELDAHWLQQRHSFIAFCVLLALTLLLANYFLYSFFHVLRGGMRQIQREVQYVAEGDLSRRPRPLGRDEAALTLALITESLGNLGGLFSVVRRGVASVAHASTEIASASGDLSRGSAAALASVASVREGIGSMVGHLEGYEHCVQQAVERARAMRTESGRSRRVMATLSERIAELQQRSREIGKIVGMIDGIAFQTHLLSLNASVEAARAGEAGKGFAVVAHEVRQLSVRVANAAQQISEIVATSIAEIEQGRAITQRSVDAVVSTEAEVLGVNQVLQRLTDLTSEGQRNARQMAGSLDQLHQFSESNAKLADQMTAAAQELRRESLQVSEQSARFKLA